MMTTCAVIFIVLPICVTDTVKGVHGKLATLINQKIREMLKPSSKYGKKNKNRHQLSQKVWENRMHLELTL